MFELMVVVLASFDVCKLIDCSVGRFFIDECSVGSCGVNVVFELSDCSVGIFPLDDLQFRSRCVFLELHFLS